MCCFVTILFILGPRIALVVWWLTQPLRFQATFPSFIWPVLGIAVLPWLTLVYITVAPGGIVGLDWLWLGLGLLIDLGSYSGGAYNRRGV